MMMLLLWGAAGLALLIVGAELVVRSGMQVATRLGVSPLVIGLTVVALGTSTPELAVGINASLAGQGELAVGNIAGTNIVNILLILGLSALIKPLTLRLQTIRLDLPAIVMASLMLLVLAWDGELSRADGMVLTLSGVAYTAALLHMVRHEGRGVKKAFADEFAPEAVHVPASQTLLSLCSLGAGLVVIVIGSNWLVDSAVALAQEWGVSDAFIGLTVVAIGTSSPELVTTVISTIRNQRDIAIGNLLGSSAYNILIILGITCLVPDGGITVGRVLLLVDVTLMTAVALLCVPVFITGRHISRPEGGLFVLAYAAYLTYLIMERT